MGSCSHSGLTVQQHEPHSKLVAGVLRLLRTSCYPDSSALLVTIMLVRVSQCETRVVAASPTDLHASGTCIIHWILLLRIICCIQHYATDCISRYSSIQVFSLD